MAKHHTYSIEFKRQVAQEYIAGETLHALAKRHDLSRNLIRIWVAKYEAGSFEDDARAADLLREYEAKIAALERMVGRQASPRRLKGPGAQWTSRMASSSKYCKAG
ncbi:MAG: helix-turn-helix domain-containing protein [Alphaproteobacteria bacterium]|nr:MAG: helix-turn-helix domain-containing protein [Alphaproteobacteria bacterium]